VASSRLGTLVMAAKNRLTVVNTDLTAMPVKTFAIASVATRETRSTCTSSTDKKCLSRINHPRIRKHLLLKPTCYVILAMSACLSSPNQSTTASPALRTLIRVMSFTSASSARKLTRTNTNCRSLKPYQERS
jgi:hypothetical protein